MQFGVSFVLDKILISDLVNLKKNDLNFAEININTEKIDIKELELQLIAIREIMDSYDLFTIIHLSHLNSRLILNENHWSSLKNNFSEQIQLIGKLGLSKKIVFHGVFGRTEDPKEITQQDIYSKKIELIANWMDIANEYNIQLLIENTDESLEDLKNVFASLPKLGFTFDIGHANINFPSSGILGDDDKITNMINRFKTKIEHIHLHDNFGGKNEAADQHLPIGIGTIDFSKFFTQLDKIKYNKTITLEIYNKSFQFIYLDASLKVIREILREKN